LPEVLVPPARAAVPTPRKYDSPVRRQRADETRQRIIDAGCRVLRHSSIRDWRALTIRGVADQAGVNERTVYRYFGNERGLRDAVMQRLEEQSGIVLEGMRLDDVTDTAARIFAHVSSYPLRPKPALDPTLTDANVRQRRALAGALDQPTARWPEADRAAAAAVLDVLWSVATYERLVSDWDMDCAEATRTVAWAIGLVVDAVERGRRPGGASPTSGRPSRR
jgi:AcrR family transcriptional regulator